MKKNCPPDDAVDTLSVHRERQHTGRLRADHLLGFGLETVGETRHGAAAHRLQIVLAQQSRVLVHDAPLLILRVLAAAVPAAGGGEADRTVGTVHLSCGKL